MCQLRSSAGVPADCDAERAPLAAANGPTIDRSGCSKAEDRRGRRPLSPLCL